MLGVIESFGLVKGLPTMRWAVVTKYEDLGQFGFPCFLKADVVGHKMEMGAVLKCYSLEDAEKNLRKMHKGFPNDKIIVQEFADGVEMIVGLKADAVFGKLLVVGFGGIFAEVNRDVAFRALPVSRIDVVSMLKDLKGVGVFKARGKKFDLEKFVTLVEKVGVLGDKLDVKELDLNPVVVNEHGSWVVDARVELE